jgi:hypothetical protein
LASIVTSGGRELVVASGRDADRLLRLAEQAHLPLHFEELLSLMEKVAGPVAWREFGGRGRVAHSAIGAASSSTHLLTEPVVNMLDAELELAHLLAVAAGDSDDPGSTYAAAERYFGIPAGGLASWDVRSGGELRRFRELALKAQVILRNGSSTDTPTPSYLDWGIGQHPAEFEQTLLSLHLGNKAEIPYLAGQYGHGAGLTLAFSLGGQVVVARRHPELLEEGDEDLVGLVLIIRRMPSETGMTNPSYWYAVPEATGAVLSFQPAALSDPRWHGVRRTCIDYELSRRSERDIYMALDHYLPEPPLPYVLHDQRGPHGERWQRHYMTGNSARLESQYRGWAQQTGRQPTQVPYRNTTYLDLDAWGNHEQGYGSVAVVATYVRQEGTDRGNELFTPVKEAEVWTLNGQVHHTRTRNHFGVDPIKLDAIRDFLVVEVKLDELSADAKALLLTTDRQGAAERRIRRQLEDAVDDVLSNDRTLRTLNDEVKDEALRQAANARMRDLDRELEEFDFFVRSERETVKRAVKQTVRRREPAHDHTA